MTRDYRDIAADDRQPHESTPAVCTGQDCRVHDWAAVGHRYDGWTDPAVIGGRETVRGGTVVYADVQAGGGLSTGHGALVREDTVLGDDVPPETLAVGAPTTHRELSVRLSGGNEYA